MVEKKIDLGPIHHFDNPADEAFFKIVKILVEFGMGKEEAEKAIAQWTSDCYTEEARPLIAVICAYMFKSGARRTEELLGTALQESRELCGLTVQGVAQSVNLKPSQVMSLEEGLVVFPDLAAVLKIEELRETLPGKLENLIRGRETATN